MAVQKLTPRYLNKDDDERLVKATEMTDALNVRVSSDDDGDALVLKNAYGNTEITLNTALPSGTNKVVGSVASEQSNSIYYFVWNSNDDHSIYKYSVGTNKSEQVYKDSVLAFNKNGFVKGNVVTSIDGDELLYFNSGTSEPKKINASKALRDPNYPRNGGSTDEEKLLFLTVAKQPPLKPPTFSIVNNASLKTNNISDKVFQFAYRYIYEDGEISALSPYSSLTTSVAQLRDGFNTQAARDFYNQINVFVRNTIADVSKIQVFAREGNEGTFYEIAEKTNTKNTNAVTISFNNQFKGEALSINDKNKLFDNVPQQADSQELVDGRMMYGGYTEGYPNHLESTDVSLIANYKDTEEVYNVSLTANSSGTASGTTRITFNKGDFPATFSEDSTIYLNVNFSGDQVTINGGSGTNDPLDFTFVDIKIGDLDGSDMKEVRLEETKDPISFIPSGIFISERIKIASGTTRDGAMAAIRTVLAGKKYNMMLAPTKDQNVVFGGSGATAFSDFTAQVSGRAILEAYVIDDKKIGFDIKELEMYIGASDTSFSFRRTLGSLFTPGGRAGLGREFFEGRESGLSVLEAASNVFFEGNKERQVFAAGIVSVTDTDGLNYAFTNPFVIGSSFASATEDSASKTFKSGSSHKMGIVYYDDRNRSGGVQEIGDVYVKPLNDRTEENNLHGGSSVVMRISKSAPSWARRWAPVYQGRGTSELKFMYTIDGAFVPFRTNSSLRNSQNNNRIYLSLNSIFSENEGYNDTTGANLQYNFEKGDRLRIVQYDGGSRVSSEFKVLGYETLDQTESNPILDTSAQRTIQRTTGNFIVIEEDPGLSGFAIKDIINRNTNWNKRCVIEVYNTDREFSSEIYYEVGKGYDVISSVHSDERVSSTGIGVTVSSVSGESNNEYFGNTSAKVFKGDVISVNSIKLNILNTYERGGVFYFYGDTVTPSGLSVGSYTGASVDNPEKVIDLSLGDAYLRRRALYTSITDEKIVNGQKANVPTTAIVEYVEDYSVSDFFPSKSSSIGRPIAPIADAKTVKRSGSITYSDIYLEDGTFNGLSSFNLSLANFKDLSYEHGSIKGLIGYNQLLYFIQENRAGVLSVNRNVIETGSGDNLVALSKNILQSEQYYVGEYGTAHPESVSTRDGMVYFADVKRGRVLRIDSQGLTIISDVNMSSYFDDKFGVISKYSPTTVIGGIDRDNDEYILSSPDITEAQVTINTDEYTYPAQVSASQVIADYEYNPSAVFSFDTEERTFSDICDEFQDSVGAVVYLEELADGGVIYVDSPYEVSNLYGVATNRDRDFYVSINVNMFLPGFTFDNSYCTSDDVGGISSDSVVSNEFTVAYGTSDKAWTTRYSFVPESIVSLNNDLYTFKSGKIYKHSESVNRNTYYGGSVAESIVETIANGAPSAIKSFESLSIEGNAAWQAVVSTTDQTATLAGTVFVDPDTTPNNVWREKEGFYYAAIHGDTSSHGSTISSVTSTSEIFSLGTVASDVTGATSITFDNDISSIPFPLGSTAAVYKLNGSQLDSLSVHPVSIDSDNTITVSGNVTVSDGDLLIVVGNSAIEGDQIRDYFAKIKLTKSSADPIELYAVNIVFADSKLHN